MFKNIQIIIIAILLLVSSIALSGCGSVNAVADSADPSGSSQASGFDKEESQDGSPEDDSPDRFELDSSKLFAEIYSSCDIMGVEEYDGKMLEELMLISADSVEEFYVRCTNGKFGVADIAIIKPKNSSRANVIEALRQFLEKRALSFENYDINNAVEVCENGEVYVQGGYVIMIAFKDNASVKEIVNSYLPY